MKEIEELLAAWLPRQRWFAGKRAPVEAVRVEHDLPVGGGDPGPHGPGMRLLVVRVDQPRGTDRYLVVLGLAEPGRLRPALEHCVIGRCRVRGARRTAYDALYDPELTARLLHLIARGADRGPLRFRTRPGRTVRTGLRSLVLTGEQSNTSLVFGEEYVLKAFRRLWPGLNPDLELNGALEGSPYAAPPHGWIEADIDDGGRPVSTTVAMLQGYLRSATDGWVLAATSVRDLYAAPGGGPAGAGGDFAAEAERLGAATAAVHRALARALPTDVLSPACLRDLADAMARRLDEATEQVPELAPYAGVLRAAFDDFARAPDPLPVQRVHGDYHLGQVVRTDAGWVLLDFEGEPAVPVAERRRPSSPLRDVAGMLRSFDYAARHQLIGSAEEELLAPAARAWADRNREAFCAGYAAGGGTDPDKHLTALRAFEYDKAVYEVLYEAHHRPTWLRVPLDSIAALAHA
ncbi:phosphotransferase [Nocardiopsis sp. RSe5-2]|uniref:Maltokinase n=1 Tax=Nocardiopsis endophytica TaxID=3018445 RepID=A0ABT4U569_9ACTN|nr:phosphotransferase [Nocardiopsis endophytica]MDA2811482.1 phosphotransferase [Nocardiopsis endophytica]